MKHLDEYFKRPNKEIYAVLNFKGGITGEQLDIAPDERGIYVAFACREYEDAYECARILYIGKADGSDTIRKRISDHYNDRDESDSGKQSYWEENYCDKGEVVVYSFAEYDKNLDDIEAALIFRNQPIANIKGIDNYIGKSWYVFIKCHGEKGCISDTNTIMKLVEGSK